MVLASSTRITSANKASGDLKVTDSFTLSRDDGQNVYKIFLMYIMFNVQNVYKSTKCPIGSPIYD